MNDKYLCKEDNGDLVIRVPLGKYECAICGVRAVTPAPEAVSPQSPLWAIATWPPRDWVQVRVPAENSTWVCGTCATPIVEARRVADQIKNEAERNVAIRIAILKGHPPKEDRQANKAFAKARGFSWMTCPRCGEECGGHEFEGDPVKCARDPNTSHLACCTSLSPEDDVAACARAHGKK